jgi:hypothetical protein
MLMVDGKHTTSNEQPPTTNYQLPITNYQLPTTNYQLTNARITIWSISKNLSIALCWEATP